MNKIEEALVTRKRKKEINEQGFSFHSSFHDKEGFDFVL